ncbi:hypothetical protein PFISCL1PPCAC_9743, partial [Pristionchus fissidentatus]
NFQIGITFAYAPNTTTTREIMDAVVKRYTEPNLLNEMVRYLLPFDVATQLPENLTISVKSGAAPFDTESQMVDYMVQSFASQCGNPLL